MQFNHIKKIFFYPLSLIIILLIVLSSVNTVLIAQDAYEYDATYEEAEYEATEYEEAGYQEAEYEEAEYEEAGYEEAIEEEATYEEVENDNLVDTEETAEMSVDIQLPLFRNYKLPITIDPQNPQLPENHNLVKLRGTVWRGEDREIRTNSRGVYAEYRAYIFFDSRSDAIAYAYLPYHLNQFPLNPIRKSYVSLIPLIKTNNYVPILAKYNKKQPPNQKFDYTISKNITRNYEYQNALEKLLENTNYNFVKEDEQYIEDEIVISEEETLRVNEARQTACDFTPENIMIVTNKVLNIVTNIITIDSLGRPLNLSYDSTNFPINSILEQNNSSIDKFDITPLPSSLYRSSMQKKSDNMNLDQYYMDFVDPNDLYDVYSDNILSKLEKLPMSMVAQSLVSQGLDPSQYIINVGGQNGGIFVHKTQDSKDPYRVIFLSLDAGMNLYEYNIKNNFDVRDSSLQSTVKARELYQQILDERINMKKYTQVHFKDIFFNEK